MGQLSQQQVVESVESLAAEGYLEFLPVGPISVVYLEDTFALAHVEYHYMQEEAFMPHSILITYQSVQNEWKFIKWQFCNASFERVDNSKYFVTNRFKCSLSHSCGRYISISKFEKGNLGMLKSFTGFNDLVYWDVQFSRDHKLLEEAIGDTIRLDYNILSHSANSDSLQLRMKKSISILTDSNETDFEISNCEEIFDLIFH